MLGVSGVRNRRIIWACRCACGKITEVRSSHLTDGLVRSCGCLRDERAAQRARDEKEGAVKVTHGQSATPVYFVYRTMHQRCEDPSAEKYPDYGGRGISVCARWSGPEGFENFLVDMGAPPFVGASIERRENEVGYCPENCVWATKKQQARNRRNSLYVEFRGRRVLLIELCEELGLRYKAVHKRIKEKGMTVEEAVTRPFRQSSR